MLLLFWRPTGGIVGYVSDIRWMHLSGYPPRCVISADGGVATINPYMKHPDNLVECAFSSTPSSVVRSCYYQSEIVSASNAGVLATPWSELVSECDVTNPKDVSGSTYTKYNTVSGLLSENVIDIDAYGDYLAMLTDQGLSWKKEGTDTFVNCLTTSGKSVYVNDQATYLADGSTIRVKRGEPVSFDSWDSEYDLGSDISRIWVNRGTIFASTSDGLYVRYDDEVYHYTALSGSLNLSSVSVEYDSSFSWGHAFTISDDCVNIINLKDKTIENSISYTNRVVLAVDYPRLYSK
jgi:hypothetical protein